MEKRKKYTCEKCGAILGTQGWLTRHEMRKHPYIPPPQKKVIVTKMPTFVPTEQHTLTGAVRKVRLGDALIITTKFIVRETRHTEGSDDLIVLLEKVNGTWGKE